MRIFWPDGAVVISRPAARASLIIGLVSGLCIQRAPRSNGTSKLAVSVWQRPPIWLVASTTITLRFAAMIRRAAAMPAAPAPITTMSASRGNGAAATRPVNAGLTARAADADRKLRRVIVMSWFPGTCRKSMEKENSQRTVPYLTVRGNTHGKSIMIDRLHA